MILDSRYGVSEVIGRYQEVFGNGCPAVDLSQKPVANEGTSFNRTKALYSDGVEASSLDFERMMGTNDLLDMNYLARGLLASQSVARIMLLGDRNDIGDVRGVATGFMVSPELLLTNYHVFRSMEEAADSVAEFDYKRDMSGIIRPGKVFRCRPDVYFFNSKEFDYALVAMESNSIDGQDEITKFGWLRLNPMPGKVQENEFVSIIQHPQGEPMQLSIRENQVKRMGDVDIWYMSDTARGSSGSPVFNDSWQVVALHHSSVPATDASGNWLDVTGNPVTNSTPDDKIQWLANEGFRISVILMQYMASAPPHRCKDALLACSNSENPWDMSRLGSGQFKHESSKVQSQVSGSHFGPGFAADSIPGGLRLTVPVVMTLNVSVPVEQGTLPPEVPAAASASPPPLQVGAEELDFDRDYPLRKGYIADFLPGLEVPLPSLAETIGAPGQQGARHVKLNYHHFTIVFDTVRRLARFTAGIADMSPEKRFGMSRKDFGKDAWRPDPRLKDSLQILNKELYWGTDFDLGHIVRREDNAWGATLQQAIHANSDTFHFTNCSPQHASFNRSSLKGLWGELENAISTQRKAVGNKMVLFAGPVLANDDPEYAKGPTKVQIPVRFWKVILCKGDDGALAAYGFVLSQTDLVGRVIREEGFEPGDKFKVYQYALKDISTMTGVQFSDEIKLADVKGGISGAPHEIFKPEELMLV